jgi:type VI secretion system protein ImpM
MTAQPRSMTGAGWFGKIPSLGDFVSRRLPASFVQPWDAWLSGELSEARLMLAETWVTVYEHAPVSSFLLGSGVVDEHAWSGILVPSVDRVGRRFPLTIALNRPHSEEPQWWDAFVALGRRALDPAHGAEWLDNELSELFCRPRDSARPAPPVVSEGTSMWWSWPVNGARHAAPKIVGGLPRAASFRELLGSR